MNGSRIMKQDSRLLSYLGIPGAATYALFSYALFVASPFEEIFGVLTCGFLFFLPIAVGGLTVRYTRAFNGSMIEAITFPLIPITILGLIPAIFEYELIICIIMAWPILALMASGGGLIVWSYEKNRKKREEGESGEPAAPKDPPKSYTFALLAILPFLIAPIENKLPQNDRVEIVQNQIVINASAAEVWDQIASVPEIQPEEHKPNLLHWAGLPRPLAATLSHEGVGGVREATFTEGLSFVETVTIWEPAYQISFDIEASSRNPLPPPLNAIGGENFAVNNGTYLIERVDADTVILHLSSEHRLTTSFNSYDRIWTRTVMSDLQQYILEIIKVRAEA